MTRDELLERLARAAPDPARFVVCAALGSCYVARSPEGRPSLLVSCAAGSPLLARTSGALLISSRARVNFSVDQREWTSPAVVVECLDETLTTTFIALAKDVAAQLEGVGSPTQELVLRTIAGWERLLRSRTILTEERELGLWGELFFILSAPSVDGAVRAWNTELRGIIDFSGGGVGIEVKTSASRLRHSVSYQQARSSDAELNLLLASVWVVPDASGRSLGDLVHAVGDQTAEVVNFEQKLLTLGFSRRDSAAYTRRFSAGGSVLYFEGATVPRVRTFDPGVTSIRYVIELDETDAIASASAAESLAQLCFPS